MKENDRVKHFLLLCSIISFLSCSLVIIAIYSDPLGGKSLNTKLIFRLLLCDLMICFFYALYYITDSIYVNNDDTMDVLCKAYLPFRMFFFVASWGFTALLAYRFSVKPKHKIEAVRRKKLPIKTSTVWLLSCIIVLPMIISNIVTRDGISMLETSGDSRQCIFNFDSLLGKVLNVVTLVIPLFATLIYNMYCYVNGVYALQTAPQSVIGRQMQRAGGYVLVLIGVWLPNCVFSMLRVVGNAHGARYHGLLNASTLLTALQGFFNVIVYVYTNKHTRQWMGTVLHENVLTASHSHHHDAAGGEEGSLPSNGNSGGSNLLSKSSGNSGNNSGVLKATNARILLNERALLAAKMEEAEYNRYMKEKHRQDKVDAPIETVERPASRAPSDDSIHSERFQSQVQAASPIARFVSPLWSQYDSDEEDECIRKSLADEQVAIANMQANAQLSDRVTVSNPLNNHANNGTSSGNGSTTQPVGEGLDTQSNTVRNSFMKSKIIPMFRRQLTGTTAGDEDGKPSSYKSTTTDNSTGRDSDKFVRFGNHQTRLISRNSERDSRMVSADNDVELQGHTASVASSEASINMSPNPSIISDVSDV